MFFRCWFVFAILALHTATALASTSTHLVDLIAYGPGGPRLALQECADLYARRYGTTVGIIKASPFELAERIQGDGDIFFTGAEYMLTDFERENPGVLDMSTAEKLFPRRVGILVRKGNPLGIEGFYCLQKDGTELMTAILEDMTMYVSPFGGSQASGRKLVYTGLEGAKTWCSSADIDAWVTYESWQVWLEDESEFIKIPCDHALRYTMVALTQRTPKRQLALEFINFLKSADAQKIFEKHGWEGLGSLQR